MSYDFDTRRFAPGGAKLAAAHLNHALDGRAGAQALAAETEARAVGLLAKLDRAGDASEATVSLGTSLPPRPLAVRFGEHPTVFDFVAAGDSASDFGPAIRRCFAAGYDCELPTTVPLATPVAFTQPGQRLFGRDRMRSGLSIAASARTAMTAAGGCLTATNLAIGPHIQNVGISFEQPATGTAWVQYPPAILIRSAPRACLNRVRVSLGWDGISLVGTDTAGVGGATVENFESSCLGLSVDVDKAFDTTRFINPQIWPFGILRDDGAALHPNAANLFARFMNLGRGYRFRRVDNLVVSKGLTLNRFAMSFEPSDDGTFTFGVVEGHDFDTHGGVEMTTGLVTINGGFMTLGDQFSRCIRASGAASRLMVIGTQFSLYVQQSNPGDEAACIVTSGAEVTFDGIRCQSDFDNSFVRFEGVETFGAVKNSTFRRIGAEGSNTTYNNEWVAYGTQARPFLCGNVYLARPEAAAHRFIYVTQDRPGLVSGNDFGGSRMAINPAFTALQVPGGSNAGVGSRTVS